MTKLICDCKNCGKDAITLKVPYDVRRLPIGEEETMYLRIDLCHPHLTEIVSRLCSITEGDGEFLISKKLREILLTHKGVEQ